MNWQRKFVSLLLIPISSSISAATIQGLVTTEDRKPLGASTVQVIQDLPRYWTQKDIEPLAEVKTDTKGHFKLDAPTTGTVALLAWAPGYRRAKFPLNVAAAASRAVGLALEPGLDITGKATNAQGQPIANALLGPLAAAPDMDRSVLDKVIPQWTRTDSSGQFAFAPVADGISYNFAAQAKGFQSKTVEVPSGQSFISFDLKPGGSGFSGDGFCERPARLHVLTGTRSC